MFDQEQLRAGCFSGIEVAWTGAFSAGPDGQWVQGGFRV